MKAWPQRPAQTLRLVTSLCLLPLLTKAQSPGLGLWTGGGVEVKVSKAFSLQANAQIRFSDNISITRAYLGELGLSYKLTKHWELSGFYRYTGRRRWNDETDAYYYRPYHRFYGELAFDHKLWRGIRFDYRLRYQNQFKDDAEGLVTDKSYLRNKFELSFSNPSHFKPFISGDVFYRIGTGIDQIRYKAGVTVQLTKAQNLDLFAFTDAPVNSGEANGLILGVTYKLKVNKRKQ